MNNYIKSVITYPESRIVIQDHNVIRIVGSCTEFLNKGSTELKATIGNRRIQCELQEGKAFWFKFKTGKGLKLIHIYLYKNNKRRKRVCSFLFYIKKKKVLFEEKNKLFNTYTEWLRSYHNFDKPNIDSIFKRIRNLYKFSILIHDSGEYSKYLPHFVQSIKDQVYENWEIILVSQKCSHKLITSDYQKYKLNHHNVANSLNNAVRSCNGEIILFIAPNQKLSPFALLLTALEFQNPETLLCYGDFDKIDKYGFKSNPCFETTFDHIRFLNYNYIGNTFFVKKELFNHLGSFNEESGIDFHHDFLLKVNSENHKSIRHIPYVLMSVLSNMDKGNKSDHANPKIKVPKDFELIQKENTSYYRPKNKNKKDSVSIIMPTACNLNFLKPCIESIIKNTTYHNYEILLLINQIRFKDEEKSAYLNSISKSPNISLIKYKDTSFNYSEVINIGVSKANFETICLMNDDTRIISNDWINEMKSWLSIDEIGAVGAKLLYPNNSIQHAGITIGLNGTCDHLEKNSSNYNINSRNDYPRLSSAVTAACMMTTKEIFNSINGFDKKLPLTYNDVDFCLRLINRDYKVLFTPFAKLYHLESVSIDKPADSARKCQFRQEINYFLTKHGNHILNDPFYSPNYSNIRPFFELAFPPSFQYPNIENHSYSWENLKPQKIFSGNILFSSEKVLVYSHYDPDGIVDTYVIKCLKELKDREWKIIFVTSSSSFTDHEAQKIVDLVTIILISDGRGRDWGNFALGLKKASEWDFPKSLLLMNDSLYGPFTNLKKIFLSMDEMDADFLGLTDSYQHNYHLQSYFIYCKPSLCQNLAFINYWKKFIPQEDKDNIIYNNEIGFTKYFSNLGFIPKALFDYNKLVNTAKSGSYGASEQMGKLKEGTFVNPSHHFADLLITQYEFPFIKIELLRINPAKISGLDILMSFIKEQYPAHYGLLADHLHRISKN